MGIGSEITSQADEAERQQVEDQLSELTSRWDSLTQTAAQRQQQLDAMLDAARKFHEVLEPFLEWIDPAEKRANSLSNLASEPGKIEQQLDKLRVGGLSEFCFSSVN